MLKLNKKNPLKTKVQTRDGRKARIICVDRTYLISGINYPIIALVSDDEEYISSFTIDGLYSFYDGKSNYDLVNIKPKVCKHNVKLKHSCEQCGRVKHKYKKVVGWVNVYNVDDQYLFGNSMIELSKEQCISVGKGNVNYIDTIKIKIDKSKLK